MHRQHDRRLLLANSRPRQAKLSGSRLLQSCPAIDVSSTTRRRAEIGRVTHGRVTSGADREVMSRDLRSSRLPRAGVNRGVEALELSAGAYIVGVCPVLGDVIEYENRRDWRPLFADRPDDPRQRCTRIGLNPIGPAVKIADLDQHERWPIVI